MEAGRAEEPQAGNNRLPGSTPFEKEIPYDDRVLEPDDAYKLNPNYQPPGKRIGFVGPQRAGLEGKAAMDAAKRLGVRRGLP